MQKKKTSHSDHIEGSRLVPYRFQRNGWLIWIEFESEWVWKLESWNICDREGDWRGERGEVGWLASAMFGRHLAGWQKQANKAHKRNKRSKRAVQRLLGPGRVSGGRSRAGSQSTASLSAAGRASRASRADDLRKEKRRLAIKNARRGGVEAAACVAKRGNRSGAPRVVGIVHLSAHGTDPHLLEGVFHENRRHVTRVFEKEGFRVTFIRAERDLLSVLDVAKVCDVLCFVLPLKAWGSNNDDEQEMLDESSGGKRRKRPTSKEGILQFYLEDAVDELGRKFISAVKAQGLPSVVGILQNLEMIPQKHRSAVKKHASNFFSEEFCGDAKLVVDDVSTEAMKENEIEKEVSPLQQQFRRTLMEMKLKRIAWREERSYMLGLKVARHENGNLVVSGYLRGRPLDVHQLIHIPGYGNFRNLQIDLSEDPHALRRQDQGKDEILAISDRSKLWCLDEEAQPDLMSGEQTWPTQEEMKSTLLEARSEKEKLKEEIASARRNKKLPEGTSDYQAAWLLGMSDDENDDDDDEQDALEKEDDLDMEPVTEEETAITLEEWKKKHKDEKDQLDFPDEVDTPMDIVARNRFVKYRGLKSFRTSPWHPKESLPREYACIFQLGNERALANEVLRKGDRIERMWLERLEAGDDRPSFSGDGPSMDVDDARVDEEELLKGLVMPGYFVTLHLEGVPLSVEDDVEKSKLPFIVGALLENEQRITVVNSTVQKSGTFEKPVKSRDELLMSCGFWRRPVRPAFSENIANSDKFKFERFLHAGRWSIASAYAPVTFGTNVPVLLLNREGTDLVANGKILDLDPDRIILKKILLSGHPIRVKRSWAVVRYMFFNPEDVKWFKPVELHTKYGMSGRITEPLGTHGLFKCSFNRPIQQNDTVMMPLYKRVFPKPVNEFSRLQRG